MAMLNFTEDVIQSLFGHEAAEDEDPARLRQYYFKSSTYDQVVTPLPLRIVVGHKGIGKSALFRVAMAELRDASRLAFQIKPDDVADIARGQPDFLSSIRAWKIGLRNIIARRAAQSMGMKADSALKAVQAAEAVIEPLAEVVAGHAPSASLDNMRVREEFLASRTLHVFVDDLDRGWEGRPADIRRISALLNAVRDLVNEDRNLQFRISLRSDVYFLVRTSDESTDKIEGSVIWQSWTNHEVFALLVKRIETFFGRDLDYEKLKARSQLELAKSLSVVMEPTFRGKGHWHDAPMHQVLMSLIRKRPRDLVKLCSLAARNAYAKKSPIIYTSNYEAIFEEYSQGRILDTINEFRSELPDIRRLLENMKPSTKEKTTKSGYVYTTADLLKKIKSVEAQGQFRFKPGSLASTKDLAAFLYKINFLTARYERADGTIVRRYFEEQRYLQSEFADYGFAWEVHPAYRWALQPTDIDKIFETLDKPSFWSFSEG
ncbi:P-loop ATPase, Sll1717 family [Micromonospora sp. NPDC049836]|uniref:P-loop ATPase, Sll1717 family n=1 Tax=Micromonospora sp. NPDC049836 TaxID=3364274 RepID=UPI0037B48C67